MREQQEKQTREKLLKAALRHITFDGWGELALLRAAQDIGVAEDEAKRLFPHPFKDMLEFYHQQGTDFIIAQIPELKETHKKLHLTLIEAMMKLYIHYKDERPAIAKASQKLALPQNQKLALHLNAKRADAIWYAFGDTATDWNYYSKRGLLMAAMLATHPIWLGDESDDLDITRQFFTRRINNIMTLPNLGNKMRHDCKQQFMQKTDLIRRILPFYVKNKKDLRMRGI